MLPSDAIVLNQSITRARARHVLAVRRPLTNIAGDYDNNNVRKPPPPRRDAHLKKINCAVTVFECVDRTSSLAPFSNFSKLTLSQTEGGQRSGTPDWVIETPFLLLLNK